MIKKSALLVLSALVVFGCSSSSSPASTTGGDGGGGGTGAKDICPLITQADVQALVVPTITGVTNVDGVRCAVAYSGDAITIEHYDNDANLSAYNNLKLDGTGGSLADQPLQGVGDQAFWNEALDGQAPPELAAHKGHVTCVIQSPEPPTTTCKTNSGMFAQADAEAYVQLMAKVCNDIFSVDTN